MFSLVSTLTLLLSNTIALALLTNESGLNKTKCLHGGTLVMKGGKYACICSYPYTGKRCDKYACVHGMATGSQYDPSNLFFNKRCLCDAGWAGELCDESIINSCGENGKKIKGKCHCRANFAGEQCDIVTKCLHGQLFNGRCSCYYGWAGDFCDQIICHQGKPDFSADRCICPSKYRGKHCDFCAQPASSPPPECAEITTNRHFPVVDGKVQIIAIVIILIVLGGLGVLISNICYKIWRRSKIPKNRK